jgi:hypothetical protein
MSNDDPYAAVTPAPPLAVRSDDLKHGEEMPLIVHAVDVPALEIDPSLTPVVLGSNLHFHTVARGRITVWVDADD